MTIYNLFRFSLLLLFLQSLFAWFLWDSSIWILPLVASISFFFASSSENCFTLSKANFIPVALIIIIEIYAAKGGNLNALFGGVFRSIILSIVLLLNDRIKINLFQFLTNSFAFLLTISMLAWILFLIGFQLPYDQSDFQRYVFRNYYLFISPQTTFDYSLIPRFSSVFLEPGQLGMITTFLLIGNQFNLRRKPVLIIFIATLLTFSLAAYIVLIISASIYFRVYTHKGVRNLYIYILFLILVYLFFYNYNNGDNVINNLIISRLQYENGDISGNNRYSSDFIDYYSEINKEGVSLFGVDLPENGARHFDYGAGYKMFILQHGIIGLLLVLMFYLLVLNNNKSKMAWILIIAYILIFLQASYPLWECELLIFITALPYFQSLTNKSDYSDIEES